MTIRAARIAATTGVGAITTLFVLAASAGAATAATAPTGRLNGTVHAATFRTLDKVLVMACRDVTCTDIAGTYAVPNGASKTDARFRITGLPAGRYRIAAFADTNGDGNPDCSFSAATTSPASTPEPTATDSHPEPTTSTSPFPSESAPKLSRSLSLDPPMRSVGWACRDVRMPLRAGRI